MRSLRVLLLFVTLFCSKNIYSMKKEEIERIIKEPTQKIKTAHMLLISAFRNNHDLSSIIKELENHFYSSRNYACAMIYRDEKGNMPLEWAYAELLSKKYLEEMEEIKKILSIFKLTTKVLADNFKSNFSKLLTNPETFMAEKVYNFLKTHTKKIPGGLLFKFDIKNFKKNSGKAISVSIDASELKKATIEKTLGIEVKSISSDG